jgi:hypothetical protein
MSVDLIFPAALDPAVWGTETSPTAEAVPLRTQPARTDDGSGAVFSWATDNPPVAARYRLEWRFRARPDTGDATRLQLGLILPPSVIRAFLAAGKLQQWARHRRTSTSPSRNVIYNCDKPQADNSRVISNSYSQDN